MATTRNASGTGRAGHHPAPAARDHTKQTPHQRGGCGCGDGDEPEEPICCGVECLVQPRFFCGQLLTDED